MSVDRDGGAFRAAATGPTVRQRLSSGLDRMAEMLSPEDVVSGYVAGTFSDGCGWHAARGDPGTALRAALVPALERAPCVIGFSGGRDSSLLLALAVHEARRKGLAPPIAVTVEFESKKTHERQWQELVISHLGVEEWVRLPHGASLDLVGPVAADGLLRHGVGYPGNAHMVAPLARLAEGGTVVTGFGGDDVLGGWPFEWIAAVLARRRSPRRGDLRGLARWCSPGSLRATRYARSQEWVRLPWLRPPHNRHAAHRIAADVTGSPRTWSARMRWLARRRMWAISQRTMDVHASQYHALTHAPLLDPGFLAAMAGAGGRLGIGDRTAVMRLLANRILPSSLIERTTKAEFSDPYFGPHTERFAQAWDGRSGIDLDVVDAAALRATWLSDQPHGLSAVLLQSAWLATQRGEHAAHASVAISSSHGDG